MTITVTLPPELERKLTLEAAQHGLPVDTYAARLIEDRLAEGRGKAAAVELLQGWIDSDQPDEQRETGEVLTRLLDEDRPSDRQLYPDRLRGITW